MPRWRCVGRANKTYLERTVVAFIANARRGGLPHQTVAHDALAFALLAETTNCRSRLFVTHNEIRMVLGHDEGSRGGCESGQAQADRD
jgi:hypothetical protein